MRGGVDSFIPSWRFIRRNPTKRVKLDLGHWDFFGPWSFVIGHLPTYTLLALQFRLET